MPIDIITETGLTVSEFQRPTVRTKSKIEDPNEDWAQAPHLYCDKLMLAANAYDEAFLSFDLGDLIQPGTAFFDEYSPLDLLGKYVRIEFEYDNPDHNITWYGFIVGTANRRAAVKGDAPADNKLTGSKQVLSAVGLEYFLDRTQIDAAVVFPEKHILRTIPFNGGRGVALDADSRTRANRSDAVNADGVYAFVPADQEGELWTNTQIVQYLLKYFTPLNKADEPAPVPFELDAADVTAAMLDGMALTLNPEGSTVFQVLNKLLSPQRGFIWWLEFDDGDFVTPAKARIRVESIATTAISLPSGGSVPANRNQKTVDFDRDRDVEDVNIAEHGSRIYHQIIVRGARQTCTGTLGNVNSESIDELVSGWAVTPTDMEAGYLHAAADTTGYGDLSEADQKERNDAFRQAEEFYQVFSYINISPEWDGKSGDGADGMRDWMFAELSDTGSIVEAQVFEVSGLRILNHTRLKRGWDYTDGENPVQTTKAGIEADYMPMFAIIQVSSASEHDKYQFVEKLGDSNFKEGTPVSDTINVSYHLHSQQNAPGFILNAAGAQHACALNHWTSAEPTKVEPQVDYETLRVTCTLESDRYCEGLYPNNGDLPADVPLQKLLLYVGDEYRLDFLANNTVVDLDNGEPVLSDGGVLRDDRKRLRDIAIATFEWYKVDRRPITVTFNRISNVWDLGMLITTIGEGSTLVNVNTVVSIITYDCTNGRTTIQTHDAALDLGRLA